MDTHRHMHTYTSTPKHTSRCTHTHTLLGSPAPLPFPSTGPGLQSSCLSSVASPPKEYREGGAPILTPAEVEPAAPGRRFTWWGLGLRAVGRRTCAPLQGGQNPQSGMGRPGRVSRNLSTGLPSLPSMALCMGSGEGTPQSGQDLRAWERHRGWG